MPLSVGFLLGSAMRSSEKMLKSVCKGERPCTTFYSISSALLQQQQVDGCHLELIFLLPTLASPHSLSDLNINLDLLPSCDGSNRYGFLTLWAVNYPSIYSPWFLDGLNIFQVFPFHRGLTPAEQSFPREVQTPARKGNSSHLPWSNSIYAFFFFSFRNGSFCLPLFIFLYVPSISCLLYLASIIILFCLSY